MRDRLCTRRPQTGIFIIIGYYSKNKYAPKTFLSWIIILCEGLKTSTQIIQFRLLFLKISNFFSFWYLKNVDFCLQNVLDLQKEIKLILFLNIFGQRTKKRRIWAIQRIKKMYLQKFYGAYNMGDRLCTRRPQKGIFIIIGYNSKNKYAAKTFLPWIIIICEGLKTSTQIIQFRLLFLKISIFFGFWHQKNVDFCLQNGVYLQKEKKVQKM